MRCHLGLTLKKALLQCGDCSQNLPLQVCRRILIYKAFQDVSVALQSGSMFLISFASDLRDQLESRIAELLDLQASASQRVIH